MAGFPIAISVILPMASTLFQSQNPPQNSIRIHYGVLNKLQHQCAKDCDK